MRVERKTHEAAAGVNHQKLRFETLVMQTSNFCIIVHFLLLLTKLFLQTCELSIANSKPPHWFAMTI